MLEDTITQNLSIADIKLRVKAASTSKSNEPTMATLLDEAYKRVRKSKALDSPKNLKALQKIVEQLEKLAERED